MRQHNDRTVREEKQLPSLPRPLGRLERRELPEGCVVVPETWSDLAARILQSKYLRKTGVPQADGTLGSEKSAEEVVTRLTTAWRRHKEELGHFGSRQEADEFQRELERMLLSQIAAPNSPQFFNTGLSLCYGIEGEAQGHWHRDRESQEFVESRDRYSRPQVHACFIQSLDDSMVRKGGIMDLWTREARLFVDGSGTGTNFSTLRSKGEKLSGGGQSSGLLSFLRIGDQVAGSIASGGTTRRAAKMVIVDLEHADALPFIEWKATEERKAKALLDAGFSAGMEGDAYSTVSGQNSNNSVRVQSSFFQLVERNELFSFRRRKDGSVSEEVPAREILSRIAEAAHSCSDPGLQFDTTINEWNTCPASGSIRASNPCAEYHFLDNTGCNLASLNLVSFYDEESHAFDLDAFRKAIAYWTDVLDVSIDMGQYPSREIAERTHEFRTIGLGYTNLGALLMRMGLSYDSREARATCACLTSVLSAEAYSRSAELAKDFGAFEAFATNRDDMLRVLRNHRRAAFREGDFEGLTVQPKQIEEDAAPPDLLQAARRSWDKAIALGELHGFRNAQATAIAPTGTISLLMDCDTTGIEPDYALTKRKTLAGGGEASIVNRSVGPALRALGYSDAEIRELLEGLRDSGTVECRDEHRAVFRTALDISPEAHLEMVAAAQPFVSGAISKTVNLPSDATAQRIESLFVLAHGLGLKAISIYRDGSKGAQPLSAGCPACGEETGCGL